MEYVLIYILVFLITFIPLYAAGVENRREEREHGQFDD